MHPHRPSPAAAVAALALFIALGGSAVAAQRYLITSTRQIKPSVLRTLHGARGPVGPQGASGPSGAQGPPGGQGPRGEAGPSNLSSITISRAGDIKVLNGKEATSVATCPTGSHAIGGAGYTGFATLNGSEMSSDHRSWIVLVTNLSGLETNLEAIVYCAAAGQAVAASTTAQAHARAMRQAETLIERLRRERQQL
ncbi:MAG TPA: hypothetical protein VGN25_10705, partial [Solirubrobacteraceae bacterium]|nr:hypothetical protein [Solirubrobacteraceae bacterium]